MSMHTQTHTHTPVVQKRFVDAFSNGLEPGKMHARVELVLVEHFLQRWSVEEIYLPHDRGTRKKHQRYWRDAAVHMTTRKKQIIK